MPVTVPVALHCLSVGPLWAPAIGGGRALAPGALLSCVRRAGEAGKSRGSERRVEGPEGPGEADGFEHSIDEIDEIDEPGYV